MSKKFVLWILALFLLSGVALTAVGLQPDREISFTRDVPSTNTPQRLAKLLDNPSEWPNWFYSLATAELVDPSGKPLPPSEQRLFEGARVKLSIVPKKDSWKKPLYLLTQVLAYKPGDFIKLRVVEDSKGKIAKLMDGLEWQINILPAPLDAPAKFKAIVRGTAKARTAGFRGRIFGTLTEKVMMSQVFYPDLIKLAEADDSARASAAANGLPGL